MTIKEAVEKLSLNLHKTFKQKVDDLISSAEIELLDLAQIDDASNIVPLAIETRIKSLSQDELNLEQIEEKLFLGIDEMIRSICNRIEENKANSISFYIMPNVFPYICHICNTNNISTRLHVGTIPNFEKITLMSHVSKDYINRLITKSECDKRMKEIEELKIPRYYCFIFDTLIRG